MTNVPLLSLMTHPLASTDNETTAQTVLAFRGVLLILGMSLCLAAVRLVKHILSRRTPVRLLAASCVVLTTVAALAVVAWRFYPIVASTR
jgi:multisubunit Na+/H+ antiporter MnhF subunit